MCLDNRSLSCSRTCLHYKSLSLVVSNQQEPLQHLEVSIPPEAELHLNVPGQQESVLLLYVCTAHRPELHLELSRQPKTLLLTVLLHYGGFCNNGTPKRCLHI